MKYLYTILITSILFLACQKNKCPETSCTEEFRIIVVDLEFVTSTPMIDSSKTFRQKDNKLMQTHKNFEYSNFVVLNDSDMDELSLEGELFISKGYFNNQEIFSEEYFIKHDCCHIIKVSGKDTINL